MKSPPSPMLSPTIRRLLHNRNFRFYLVGRVISVIGDSFYTVALILAVLASTHSVTSGSMVLIAGTIPVITLTLVGGTVSDRLPRNRVMLASDLVRCATQYIMAALLSRSNPPLWALLITQLCYGAAEAFFEPASTGLLPQIVAFDELPAAMSLLGVTSNGALVIGPALAGGIIALAGAPLAIAFDGASFLLSAISLSFLRVSHCGSSHARESFARQVRAGFVEVCKHRWVLISICYFALLAFAFNGTMLALGPAAALSRLGGPWAWSLILSTFGIGLIFGSLVALRLLKTRFPLGCAYTMNFGLAPLLVVLGTSHSVLLVVVASGLAGLSVSVFSTTFPTLVAQTIPNEILSRVGSYFWLARIAPMPVAFAIVGPLSARFGLSIVLDVAALLICAATLTCATSPTIWSIRSPLIIIRDSGD